MKNRILQAWRFLATHKLNTLIAVTTIAYAPFQYDNVWWWSTCCWIAAAFMTEWTSNIWREAALAVDAGCVVWRESAEGWESQAHAWRDLYYQAKAEQTPPL